MTLAHPASAPLDRAPCAGCEGQGTVPGLGDCPDCLGALDRAFLITARNGALDDPPPAAKKGRGRSWSDLRPRTPKETTPCASC